MNDRWVALDVGETLVNETRVWQLWADAFAISQLTLMASLGAAIAQGGDHQDGLQIAGAGDWRVHRDEVARAYGGFRADDLYPDALPLVGSLRAAGYRVAILANQPAVRSGELRALGFAPDVMAMSEELGVAKPDPGFFERSLELLGDPDPGTVAYVGDRVDNDVLPAARAGMRAIWLRRGPWGAIQRLPDTQPSAALVVDSLEELARRIGEAWD